MTTASALAQTKKYFSGYRKRIIISLILFFLVIFLPLVLYGIITDRSLLAKNIEDNGQYLVRNLAENSELGVFSENSGYLKSPLEAILKEQNAVWAAIYNRDGQLILSALKLQGMERELPDAVKSLVPVWQKDQVHKQTLRMRGRMIHDFFFPVYLRSGHTVVEYEEVQPEQQAGQLIGIARVGMTLEGLRQRTLDIVKAACMLAAACLIAGIFAIWFVTRSITRPLRQLEAAAGEIGRGNLTLRIDLPAGDEIGSLGQSFNGMADQLQHQMQQRQKTEDEMRRLISAVEQADEMIIVMNASGTIEYANPAAGRTTGFQIKELLGKNPFSLRGSTYNADFSESIWGRIISGETWTGRVSETKKDGSLFKLAQTITPVRSGTGKIVSFVSIGRDITGEQLMEEQLRQSQKLEAIGVLAGGIAHDFNNILGAIMGYTELSLDAANLDGQLRHNLEQILKSSLRAAGLVRQILSFSRKSEQERKSVQFGLLIQEALALLRATIPATIEIRQHLPDDEISIMADPGQLHQVIMNLCTNAAQAMSPHGGTIELSLDSFELCGKELVKHPELQPGQYARLTVCDTGPGIASNIIEHIFEPFFTTKEVGKGTGMGLAVVDGIVRSHGGAIRVENIAGRGAAFTVLLPRGGAAAPPEEALPSELPGGNEHILLLDDENFLVDSGGKMLQSLGYRVTVATDSLEALAVFRQTPGLFDLVITDYTMPQMTGYDFALRLFETRPDVPVILCTGYSETISPEKAAAAGIRSFIYKPVSKYELAVKIREALEGG